MTRALALYQDTYLPEDILTKVDRASMACSLEVRAPFLDAVLVDSIEAMPPAFKYSRRQTKRLLNKSFQSGFEQALDDEGWSQAINFGTADTSEALAAFLDKREPVFRGQ